MSISKNDLANLSIQDSNQSVTLGETKHEVDPRDLVAAQLARNRGWVEPQEFDYGIYNATPQEAKAAEVKAAEEAADLAGTELETTQDVPTWASNAAKYEWKEEYGDVGPVNPELEKLLFKDDLLTRAGHHFAQLHQINVTIESTAKVKPVASFEDAGLHPIMLQNVKLCNYKSLTPIQAYCLPSVLLNHDVIGVAQTGSGKTAAFLIPTISKLMGKAKKLAGPRPNITTAYNEQTDGVRAEPLALVVVPTRELAVQIFMEARRLCYRSMLRPCVIYGGAPTREQMTDLRMGCDILIATPGRLRDFMVRGSILSLNRVKFTIIDEADELVAPDWMEDMKMIMSGCDNNEDADHIFMMFSATFPKEARQLARQYLADDHIRIRVGRAGSTHKNIQQSVIFVEESKKRECLYDLLMSMPPARTMIFVNNKKAADFVDDFLYNKGLPSTSIHSDRTQREREDALRAFKAGKAPILVATGVSARGIDIKNVMHIINYNLPSVTHGGIDEYVHRIGRTARIGNDGAATSFYNDRDTDLAPSLVKVLLECSQEVPDFLQEHIPEEGAPLDFDDDTDNEGEVKAEGKIDAWGSATPAETSGSTKSPAAFTSSAWAPSAEASDGAW